MKHILWFVFGFRLVGGFGFWLVLVLVVGLFTSIIHIPFVLLSIFRFSLFPLRFSLLAFCKGISTNPTSSPPNLQPETCNP